MQPTTFNEKSLHVRVATVYGQLSSSKTDICSFISAFLKGCLMIALATTFGAVIMYSVTDLFLWIYTAVFVYPVWPQGPGTLWLILGPVGLIAWLMQVSSEALKSESFGSAVYRSWKDKVCFPVEIK